MVAVAGLVFKAEQINLLLFVKSIVRPNTIMNTVVVAFSRLLTCCLLPLAPFTIFIPASLICSPHLVHFLHLAHVLLASNILIIFLMGSVGDPDPAFFAGSRIRNLPRQIRIQLR